MEVKNVNRVIEKYDILLSQSNRQVVLLSSLNEELLLELEDLKNEVIDLKIKLENSNSNSSK